MSLFSRLPFLHSFVPPADLEQVEKAFAKACERAGVKWNTLAAEKIGIDILADYAALSGGSGTVVQQPVIEQPPHPPPMAIYLTHS